MLELAQIFTSGAVLQKGREIKIWGTCDGECVKISLGGRDYEAKANADGSFECKLGKYEYGGPYVLSAMCENDTVVCDDVYIGEIYVAGGQSNMEYRLRDDKYVAEEMTVLNNPMIRYYNVPRIGHTDAVPTAYKSVWKKVTEQCTGDFPAAGYYFAKQLNLNLGVAVGIIDCNWGATSASAWMSEEYLCKNEETKIYMQDFENLKNSKTKEQLGEEVANYDKSVAEWNDRYKDGVKKGLRGKELDAFTGGYPWLHPLALHREFSPCMLYNTMFRRIVKGYTVAGAIYYQGESDAHRADMYEKLFGTMIDNWRSDLEYWDMPFYFVQLAGFGCDGNPDKEEWAKLREAQYMTSQHKLNVYQAVILDAGDEFDIHPKDKRTVGERLAKLALHYTYKKDVKCDFPEPSGRVLAKEGKIILEFKNTYDGLCVKGQGKGFEIAEADGKFFPAEVEVDFNRVILSCDKVYNVKAIKYAYKNYPDYCLYNSENLPANPFMMTL